MATATVTLAMLRTWAVRLLAMELTLSVRSFQVPATPLTCACPPSLPSVPGQVAGHGVDALREVLPGAGHAFDLRLPAELAFGAHLAGDASDLGSERAELADHRVDRFGCALEFAGEGAAFGLKGHRLRQVAFGDGADDPVHVSPGLDEVGDEGVDGLHAGGPFPRGAWQSGALAQLALAADDLAQAFQFSGLPLIQADDLVERVTNLSLHAGAVNGQADGEISGLHGHERLQEARFVQTVGLGG